MRGNAREREKLRGRDTAGVIAIHVKAASSFCSHIMQAAAASQARVIGGYHYPISSSYFPTSGKKKAIS